MKCPTDRRLVYKEVKISLPSVICFYTCGITTHASHKHPRTTEAKGGREGRQIFVELLTHLCLSVIKCLLQAIINRAYSGLLVNIYEYLNFGFSIGEQTLKYSRSQLDG